MFHRAFYLSENTESFHKADQRIGFYVMTSIRFEAWKKNESKIFFSLGLGIEGLGNPFQNTLKATRKISSTSPMS